MGYGCIAVITGSTPDPVSWWQYVIYIKNCHGNFKTLSKIVSIFSCFPELLLDNSVRFHNKWRRDYLDRLIREDLRDLTRIQELENIATIMHLLPERISSPLSINALAKDIKCSFASVSNYLKAMELGYLIFRISPYSKRIARSLTKEKKPISMTGQDWMTLPSNLRTTWQLKSKHFLSFGRMRALPASKWISYETVMARELISWYCRTRNHGWCLKPSFPVQP